MGIKIEKVYERDMDLLFMSLCSSSRDFFSSVLTSIGLKLQDNEEILEIVHSMSDNSGESDITIIYGNEEIKTALLIEDKIDATAQDEQKERYIVRGNNGMKDENNKLYDSFHVMLFAPEAYIASDTQNYPHSISYETVYSIISNLDISNKEFALSLIDQAVNKQKEGYTQVVHETVTNFINDYIELFIALGYDKETKRVTKRKGNHSEGCAEAEFKTNDMNLRILHKMDRGFVDLTFKGCRGKTKEIRELLEETVPGDSMKYLIVDGKANVKSAVIRKRCNVLDKMGSFEEQKESAIEGMEYVLELTKLANSFKQESLNQLFNSVNQ